jgi:hypothetical protein
MVNITTLENYANIAVEDRFLYTVQPVSIQKNNYMLIPQNHLLGIYDHGQSKMIRSRTEKSTTYFIDIWENKKISKNYIVRGTDSDLILSNFRDLSDSKKITKRSSIRHSAFIIDAQIPTLVVCDYDGYLETYDLNKMKMLQSFKVGENLCGMVCWNERYFFVAGKGSTVLVDIVSQKILKELFFGEKSKYLFNGSMKLFSPVFGECLICASTDHQLVLYTKLIN